jgi:hypothetical protein
MGGLEFKPQYCQREREKGWWSGSTLPSKRETLSLNPSTAKKKKKKEEKKKKKKKKAQQRQREKQI